MEENDDIILSKCRLQVIRMGKQLNVFSIIAVLGIILTVLAGLGLIAFSGEMDDATEFYLDNFIGLIGMALIVVAALAVPMVVIARNLVHIAKHIKINNDDKAMLSFLHQSKALWKYITIVLTVILAGTVLTTLAIKIYLSTLHGGL